MNLINLDADGFKIKLVCGKIPLQKQNVLKHENVRKNYQKYSIKKDVLQISQNSQENTCTSVSFSIKLEA